MKKNYIIPEMTAMELCFTSALLSGSDPDNDKLNKDNGNSFGGAPSRKVF